MKIRVYAKLAFFTLVFAGLFNNCSPSGFQVSQSVESSSNAPLSNPDGGDQTSAPPTSTPGPIQVPSPTPVTVALVLPALDYLPASLGPRFPNNTEPAKACEAPIFH